MPNTKEELYLAAILGEYSGELPLPNTKVECYLYKLATDGVPGGSGGGSIDLSEYAKKKDLVGLKTADGGEIFNDYTNNIATTNSHAEGYNTKANGNCSHTEGNGTTASSNCTHAEGCCTTASGDCSHAEGAYTTASAPLSHAEGNGTKASSNYQHVQGKFNVEDSESKYAFIIGNGDGDSNRSNAIAIDWDGLFYLNNSDTGINLSEISGNVKKLINDSSRHVHTNMQALMEITDADITALHSTFPQKIYEIEQSLSDYATKEEVAQTTEKVAQLDSSVSQLNRKTIKFRHGKGTFNATATGTNIVWKYGSQEIQGESCTFDVKSDNGLIVIEFYEITKITINNDALNKLCLSDLGGNTISLNLHNCSNITGDLSDLGGKITNTLDLYKCSNITGDLSDLGGNTISLNLHNCSNITGDLSDLGGKITNWLDLNNCTNITGVYYGTKYPKYVNISKTSVTPADMDANLINFAASGVKSGTFVANGMKRTAASDNAIATLVANGWTVSGLTKEG